MTKATFDKCSTSISASAKHCHGFVVNLSETFLKVWITGSANQKVSNVLDHTSSNVHKATMARLRAVSVRARGRSAVLASAIGHSLSMMDRETRARMGRKFELCFVIAKECIPLLNTRLCCSSRSTME